MKYLVLFSLFILSSLMIIKASRERGLQNIVFPGDENIANAITTGIANGDFASTTSTVLAQATKGNTSIGVGGSSASTDTVKTQSGVVAVAKADENVILAKSMAHQETTAQKAYGQQANAGLEQISDTSYLNQDQTVLYQDNTVAIAKTDVFKLGQNKLLTNNREIITDKTTEVSQLQSATDTPGDLSSSYKKEVVITLDSGTERVIIERIISRDDRVIIVNAAKYIHGSLQQTEINLIKQLRDQPCNCIEVKDYLIEMLAESS